ncbi:MAG: DUF5681 domain-containing protein [Candidatus Acidiferrales bacterium]
MAKRKKPGNRLKSGDRRGNPKIAEAGKATRFQPGNSGNKSGRPRDIVSQVMREMLPEPCPLDKNGLAWAEAIALAVFKKALRGDVRAAAEVFDRTEGRPKQSVQLSATAEVRTIPTSLEEIDRRLLELINVGRERRKTIDVPRLSP